MSQYSSPEAVLVPGPVTLVGPPEAAVDAFLAVVLFFAVSLWASTIVAARTIVPITKRILSIHVLQFSGSPVVVQLCKEASQTRDYCVERNATLRAARPDPSLRKERLLRMTMKLHHYRCPPLLATRTHLLLQSKINYGLILQCDRSSCPEYRRAVDPAGG